MREKIVIALVGCSAGRLVLHLICMMKGGNFKWHMQGIRREIARATTRKVL